MVERMILSLGRRVGHADLEQFARLLQVREVLDAAEQDR